MYCKFCILICDFCLLIHVVLSVFALYEAVLVGGCKFETITSSSELKFLSLWSILLYLLHCFCLGVYIVVTACHQFAFDICLVYLFFFSLLYPWGFGMFLIFKVVLSIFIFCSEYLVNYIKCNYRYILFQMYFLRGGQTFFFFGRSPGNKYFRLCVPYSLCCSYSFLLFWYKSSI